MNQIVRLIAKAKDKLASLEDQFKEEKAKLVFHIEILEKELASMPASPRKGRRQKGKSVAQFAEKALERFPQGLNPVALVAEMERLGWTSESANKPNIVNTQLHLAAKEGVPVKRTDDGRWVLVKRTPKTSGGVISAVLRGDLKAGDLALVERAENEREETAH